MKKYFNRVSRQRYSFIGAFLWCGLLSTLLQAAQAERPLLRNLLQGAVYYATTLKAYLGIPAALRSTILQNVLTSESTSSATINNAIDTASSLVGEVAGLEEAQQEGLIQAANQYWSALESMSNFCGILVKQWADQVRTASNLVGKVILPDENITKRIEYDNEMILEVGDFPFEMALHRRELVDLPALAFDVAADRFLLKKVRLQRITYIAESILENLHEFRDLLYQTTHTLGLSAQWQKEIEKKQKQPSYLFFYQMENEAKNELDAYLADYHTYATYNPLKSGILLIGTRVLLELGTEQIKRRLLMTAAWNPSYYVASQASYTRDRQGNLCAVFPRLSPTYVATALWAPRLLFENQDYGIGSAIRYYIINSFIKGMCGINSTLVETTLSFGFSVAGDVFWRLLSIGWGLSAFDAINQAAWREYVHENKIEFLAILDECLVLDEQDRVSPQARKKLVEFIARGHTLETVQLTSLAELVHTEGARRVGLILSIPVMAATAYGAFKLVKLLFFNS